MFSLFKMAIGMMTILLFCAFVYLYSSDWQDIVGIAGFVFSWLASLWGSEGNQPVDSVMGCTIALVVALLAVCVTMHTFLFAELNSREHNHPGEREVCRDIQSDHVSRVLKLSLWSAGAVLACYWSLSFYEASGEEGKDAALAFCSIAVLTSLVISYFMILFCIRSAKYKDHFRGRAKRKMIEIIGDWDRVSKNLPREPAPDRLNEAVWDASGDPLRVDTLVRCLAGARGIPSNSVPDRFSDFARVKLALCDDDARINGACKAFWVSLAEAVGCFYRFSNIHDAYRTFSSGDDVDWSEPKSQRDGIRKLMSNSDVRLSWSQKDESHALSLTAKLWVALTSGGGGQFPLVGSQVIDVAFGRASLENSTIKGARLRDSSFADVDFHGASAKGAVFENCDFSGATLQEANFEAATFQSCELTELLLNPDEEHAPRGDSIVLSFGTNLKGCRFIGCALTEAYLSADSSEDEENAAPGEKKRLLDLCFSLDETFMRDSTMRNSFLQKISLDRCSWVNSSLNYSKIELCTAKSANFSRTSFFGGYLYRLDAPGACFTSASFGRVLVKGLRCEAGMLAGVSFQDAAVENGSFRRSEMDGVSFSSCRLNGVDFRAVRACSFSVSDSSIIDCNFGLARMALRLSGRCRVVRSCFCESEMPKSDFCEAKLTHCEFVGTRLGRSRFSRVCLWDTKFREAVLSESSFLGAYFLKDTKFIDCSLKDCDFSNAQMKGVTFLGCDFSKSTFRGARLRGCVLVNPSGLEYSVFKKASLDEVKIIIEDKDERNRVHNMLVSKKGVRVASQ